MNSGGKFADKGVLCKHIIWILGSPERWPKQRERERKVQPKKGARSKSRTRIGWIYVLCATTKMWTLIIPVGRWHFLENQKKRSSDKKNEDITTKTKAQ